MKAGKCPICDRKTLYLDSLFCERHDKQFRAIKKPRAFAKIIAWSVSKARAHERIQARKLSKSKKVKS